MEDNVEIIRSNKGGMKIIHRGYMYTVHKRRQTGGIRWRCTQRSLQCKGSISTGYGPPRINMPHNHIPDPHSVALARCRQFEELADFTTLPGIDSDERTDALPLPQLSPQHSPQTSDTPLKSQSLSPTKLRVVRQSVVPQVLPIEDKKPVVEPEEEEVCLRWNSHHSNMQTAFPSLLQREQYVDVTLAAEGRTLKCHKLILSSCSAYFDEILSEITPLQHPVILLKDIPFWILKSLCDFMYAGEVHIDQNKLEELLQVAEVLKIKGLARKSNAPPSEPSPQPNLIQPKQEIIEPPPPVKTYKNNRQSQSFSKITNAVTGGTVDPLQLLQPSYQEESTESESGSLAKAKEKVAGKKLAVQKKLRKRKNAESPVPVVQYRKGTRSRPQVKIPRYYHDDYNDVIKPTPGVTESDEPLFPVEAIKTEPIDVVENDLAFNDTDTDAPFEDLLGFEQSEVVNPVAIMSTSDPEETQKKANEFVKIALNEKYLTLKDKDGEKIAEDDGAVEVSEEPPGADEKTISKTVKDT